MDRTVRDEDKQQVAKAFAEKLSRRPSTRLNGRTKKFSYGRRFSVHAEDLEAFRTFFSNLLEHAAMDGAK
jgi:hypothetical protein